MKRSECGNSESAIGSQMAANDSLLDCGRGHIPGQCHQDLQSRLHQSMVGASPSPTGGGPPNACMREMTKVQVNLGGQ
jgi:hypothetical protein